MSISTTQQAELDKFSRLAQQWWDATGPMHTLHDINPLRVQYISQHAQLKQAQVADIGCGAGILSESLAKQGAQVTALDLSESLIAVAKEHAATQNLDINYQHNDVAALAQSSAGQFDVVSCMEMLEHVDEPQQIIQHCAELVKPGGHVFFSTLNRTFKAWALAIAGAEYVLNLLPRGTHQYEKFIRPSELNYWAAQSGLKLEGLTGFRYNPLTKQAAFESCPDVNYLIHFSRPQL